MVQSERWMGLETQFRSCWWHLHCNILGVVCYLGPGLGYSEWTIKACSDWTKENIWNIEECENYTCWLIFVYRPRFCPKFSLQFGPKFGPKFSLNFGLNFSPKFGPKFSPKFGLKFSPKFSPKFGPKLAQTLNGKFHNKISLAISPSPHSKC